MALHLLFDPLPETETGSGATQQRRNLKKNLSAYKYLAQGFCCYDKKELSF